MRYVKLASCLETPQDIWVNRAKIWRDESCSFVMRHLGTNNVLGGLNKAIGDFLYFVPPLKAHASIF